MKFAKCNCNFENSLFEYKFTDDDIFVVTPEFEDSPEFKEGLRVGNFEFVEIETIGVLKRVIGVTDEIIAEFEVGLVVEEVLETVTVPEPEPEPEPTVEPEIIDEDEITVPDEVQPPDETENETPDVPDEDDGDETGEDEEADEEPVLAFTEEADGWQAAVALVKDETDIEKLEFALKEDDRKSVRAACEARLVELKENVE